MGMYLFLCYIIGSVLRFGLFTQYDTFKFRKIHLQMSCIGNVNFSVAVGVGGKERIAG